MSEGAGRFVSDRYRIVRELGRGGMGVVYLGHDLQRDLEVAIKVRSVTHHEALLWLKREFRAVASLRHPNLVELYELVAHDRSCYFTMEYLRGIDPRRWIGARVVHEEDTQLSVAAMAGAPAAPIEPLAPQIDFERLRTMLAQLAEALHFLHSRGVIHRDIKPSNILMIDGTLKLLDFGLALEGTKAQEEVLRETRIVGTVAYLAPEYIDRLEVSPAIDIYALGVLAFELVTGAPPFGGTLHVLSRMRKKLTLPRASSLNPAVPPDLDELIDQLLSADPADRPPALEVALRLTGAHTQPRPVRRSGRFVGRGEELTRLVDHLAADTRRLAMGSSVSIAADTRRLAMGSSVSLGEEARRAIAHSSATGDTARGSSPDLGDALRAAAAEPAALARGRFVVVTGPSGAGKSALVEQALGRSRTSESPPGFMWRGRCHERERVPYRAFDFVIDDLAAEIAGDDRLAASIEHVGALGRVFPSLGSVLGAGPAVGDLRVERGRALIAMTQLFDRVIANQRGVIVIDDLQWADEDSLELLALLVEQVSRPLAILATWTADDADGLPPLLAALLERLGPKADHIALPPLEPDEVVDLIAAIAPQIATVQIEAAARHAAGSPYLAELIGRELADADASVLDRSSLRRDRTDQRRVHPDRAEQRRLARLEPAERTLAELVALALGPATFEQLRALAELPAPQLSYALRTLEHERIVRATPSASGEPTYTFYHQRLRDAAHLAMSPDKIRATHERFAALFERAGGPPEQLAYHHEQAGTETRAAHWAIVAARAARAQLAWSVAVDWFSRAIALGAPDVYADHAECLFLAGKLRAAAGEFERLSLRGGGVTMRAGDAYRVRAAEAFIKLGELERGVALIDDVLARHGEPRARGRAASTLRTISVAARWLSPIRSKRAPADDVLTSAYRVIASFLSTPYPIEAFEYVLRGLAVAERAGDRDAHSLGMAMLAAYLGVGSLGRFGDRALATARKGADSPYPRMVAAGAAGILATLRGEWAAMRDAHDEGRRICERLGLERSWEASFLRTYQGLGEYYAGEPARALELLGEIAHASDDLISRAMLGSYRGRALLLEGDLAEARDLAAALAQQPAAQRGLAAIYRQVFAAELALAEGDYGLAEQTAHQLARAARGAWLSALPAVSAMIDTLLATAEIGRREPDAARRARMRAKALYRRGRTSFYAATALRLWGQAEHILGEHRAAENVLARAETVAAQRGGKLDRLAIAALNGNGRSGELRFAVHWATAGMIER